MADEYEPSLEHGPNPALSAQPGVDEPSVFSMPEYSPGADPYSTGEAAPAKAKAASKAKTAKAEAEAEEPEADAEPEAAEHKSAGGKAGGRP